MFENHHDYINVVSSGVFCPYVIFTSNFNTVKTELKKHKRVALHGPKGCGKSLLSIVMYLLFMEVMDCLYVTPRSFEKDKFVVEYFKEVANKLEDQHTHS